jgi:hypothetical protein
MLRHAYPVWHTFHERPEYPASPFPCMSTTLSDTSSHLNYIVQTPFDMAYHGPNAHRDVFPVSIRHHSRTAVTDLTPKSHRHGFSASQPNIPIDPALIPLPDDDDRDICDPRTIIKAIGIASAKKTAGSRRSALAGKQRMSLEKGKRKAIPDDGDQDTKPAKRGRPAGSGNYNDEDLTALLDFVEEELPLGQRGWRAVHTKLNKWAHQHQRPERPLKSVETKYKQVRLSIFIIFLRH